MNVIQIKGFVGNVQQIRQVGQRNTPVLNFSVGTNRMSKRPNPQTGQQAEFETTWHNVTVWGDTATQLVNAGLQKGSKVFVQGRQDNYKYTDQKTGNEVPATRIIATDVDLLQHVKQNQGGGNNYQQGQQQQYQQPQGQNYAPQAQQPQNQPYQQPQGQQQYQQPQGQQGGAYSNDDDDLPF